MTQKKEEKKCEHNVVAKYCFRCKRPDLAGTPPQSVEKKCCHRCLNLMDDRCLCALPNCPCHTLSAKVEEIVEWVGNNCPSGEFGSQKDFDRFDMELKERIKELITTLSNNHRAEETRLVESILAIIPKIELPKEVTIDTPDPDHVVLRVNDLHNYLTREIKAIASRHISNEDAV